MSTHVSQHNYNLVTECCRQTFRRGVVCIFLREKLKFSNVNLNEFCKEVLEVCAVKLPFPSALYSLLQSSFWNLLTFLKWLRCHFKSLYNTNSKLIICDDINVNYLVGNNRTNN
jgi:hypothetical protein